MTTLQPLSATMPALPPSNDSVGESGVVAVCAPGWRKPQRQSGTPCTQLSGRDLKRSIAPAFLPRPRARPSPNRGEHRPDTGLPTSAR